MLITELLFKAAGSQNQPSTDLEAINNLTIPNELLNPSNRHPVRVAISEHSLSPGRENQSVYLRAPLRIRKVLMIIHQMLLIPRILLHTLVILNILKNNLAEAIEVRNIAHLRVEELGHQRARRALVMDLFCI